jgi:hypothetical protein
VQRQPQDVDRRLDQLGRHPGQEQAGRRIRVDHRPAPVDEDRWIRLVAREHIAQRRQHGRELRTAELTFGIGGCESAG